MINQENFIYQISTNPIVEAKIKHLPIKDSDTLAFGFVGDFCLSTGMMNSLDKTISALKTCSLVYMTGELDQSSYFELGLAISLGKKIYYVTEEKHDTFDFQLPYDLGNLIPINYTDFLKRLDDI